jgi:hypothetical protein
MVASWVGEEAPTSSPIETRWAVTMPSNGDLGSGLGLQQVSLRVVAVGGGRIQGRLRHGLALHQVGLALVIGIALSERRLRAGLCRLRLIELELIGLRLDCEQ